MLKLNEKLLLYKAIHNKQHESVIEYIKNNELVNTKIGPEQMYPIELAALNNDEVLLNYFLQTADEEKIWLATLAAVRKGHLDIFKFLCLFSKIPCDKTRFVDEINNQKLTHYAAIYGNSNILLELQNLGFNLNEPINCLTSFDHGKNVLQLVMENDHEDCALILYNNGCTKLGYNEKYVWSFIHLAAAKGYLKLIQAYHNEGGDLDLLDRNDQSPLLWAASTGQIEVMKYLIDQKVAINNMQSYRLAPIFWAVVMGQTEAVKILLEAEAKFDFECLEYHHPKDIQLKYSSLNINGNLFALGLAAAGVISPWFIISALFLNVNLNNNLKLTLLHIAAQEGYEDIVKLLYARGSNSWRDKKNRDNKTAIDLAKDANHEDIVIFLKYGGMCIKYPSNPVPNYFPKQSSTRSSFYQIYDGFYRPESDLGNHARLFKANKAKHPDIIVESHICDKNAFDSHSELMQQVYSGEYRTQYFSGSLKNNRQCSVRFIRQYFPGETATNFLYSSKDVNEILKALEVITNELIRIHRHDINLNKIDFKKIILSHNSCYYRAVFIDFSKSTKDQKVFSLFSSENQKNKDILLYAQKLEEFLYLHPQGIAVIEKMPSLAHFIEDCVKQQETDLQLRLQGLFNIASNWCEVEDEYDTCDKNIL